MKKILENNERAWDLSTAGDALADPAGQSIALPAMLKDVRPRVHGKFLFVGDEKLYVRGVTYGTFRSDADGNERYDSEIVARDLELMAENGINAIRTYTV